MARTSARRKRRRRSGPGTSKRPRPKPKPGRPPDRSYGNLSLAKRRRVDGAIELCAAVVTDSWQATVAERAADYAVSDTFRKLVRSRRRHHCKALAEVAQLILAAKNKAHEVLGLLGGGLMSLLGFGGLAKRFARELIERIPLPFDAKVTAAARGVQITGILLCVLNGDELRRCQCFIDLALEQAKTAVKKILTTAMEDWTQLALFTAKA
ncbi:hypothetical protein ACQPYH_16060 [Kribbella sp. CA-245084]|uniref:hypothetical protein n=1 Tax=Kribbella sp. CA-245084 TaxID=3239940 RepID=UPI003D906DD3